MSFQKLLRKKQRALGDNNLQQLAIASHNLGNWCQENQEHENALENYKEEAKAYKGLNKRLETSKAYRMIGETYMLLEDFENALSYELKYLKIALEENNKPEEQRAYATIGRVYLLQAQSNPNGTASENVLKHVMNAEKAFLKSLKVCDDLTSLSKLEVLDMKARLFLNLGLTNECKGDFDASVKYMESAMSICRHNDFWELLHQCYFAAGSLYSNKLSDTTRSLRFFNMAISTAERLSSQRALKICQTLISKSEVLVKMNDFQSAKQVLHKAYKLKTPDASDRETIEKNLKVVVAMCRAEDALITAETENYSERKRLYELMGDGWCKLKNYSAAISYYLKMLDAAEQSNEEEKQLIPIYISLYQTYKDNNEYSSALEYMWKEYELSKDNNAEAFNTLFGIAQTSHLAGKDFWDVDAIFERAKKEAQLMASKKKEKLVIIEQIELRKKCGMETMAKILHDEALLAGHDIKEEILADDGDGFEIDSEELTEELHTPEVGDDICLDDLSDAASESDNDEKDKAKNNAGVVSNNTHRLRRRGCFKVTKNEKGETQLHRACITGNTNQARRLIDQGHPVNLRDHAGWLPLHEAANHGFKEIVELLLDNGALINDKGGTSSDGITPLYDACVNGHLEIVELLLDRDANATLRNDLNKTPLHALEYWRKTNDLDASAHNLYQVLHSRLKQKLEKAGIETAAELKSPANKTTPAKRRSLSVTPRKRIISNSSSSEDDRVETVDSILNEAFPNPNPFENQSQDIESTPPSSPPNGINYREVMAEVRKGNLTNRVEILGDTLKPVEKITKRPGLLAENEVDVDHWLDNDLAPTRKKRRYVDDRDFMGESSRGPGRTSQGSHKRVSQCSLHSSDNAVSSTLDHAAVINIADDIVYSSDNSDDNNADAFNVLMSSNGIEKKRKRRRSSVNSSRSTLEGSSRQQSSLLDSGFSRHRVASPDNSHFSVSSTVTSPFKNSMVPLLTVSIKVKVENDLLNVPVNKNSCDDLTIEWLAEEAAKRYYNLKGVKPVLRLTTQDGAIFENSDPISLAFLENSVIASTVLEWIMPPLAQRYAESCSQFRTSADPFIQSQLELISSTQSLSITDQILVPKLSRPMLKSIHFQSNLMVIDLANSFLEDDGVKYLAQALSTIPQLASLNLSGNLITSVGLKHLSSIFDAHVNALSELKTLNLNFNPLQNQSLSSLSKFCMNLRQLKSLQLSSTELTNLEDHDLRFNELSDLDVSCNSFVPGGLVKAMEKLNASKITKLNLSFCIELQTNEDNSEPDDFIDPLVNLLNNGTCANLEEIYLMGCNLNDTNCWRLLQSINRSKILRVLSLRDNQALSKISFKFLLENIFVRNLFLEGCRMLLNDITDADVESILTLHNCCENIYLSLSHQSSKEADLLTLQKIWNIVSRCDGKLFINDMKVLMTLKPDNVSTDEWHYCYF